MGIRKVCEGGNSFRIYDMEKTNLDSAATEELKNLLHEFNPYVDGNAFVNPSAGEWLNAGYIKLNLNPGNTCWPLPWTGTAPVFITQVKW